MDLFESSEVVRIETYDDPTEFEKDIADEDLSGAIIIPPGFSDSLLDGGSLTLTVLIDPGSNAALSVQTEAQAIINRLLNAIRTAEISIETRETLMPFVSSADQREYFNEAVVYTLDAWEDPPIVIDVSMTGESPPTEDTSTYGYAYTSPGMMAQFAIAGLIGAAEIIVRERKTRALQRLLTTSVSRFEILVGHFMAMFVLILIQFTILIAFGQLFLGLRYDNSWSATVLITVAMCLTCAGLGSLIGVIARNEEQVIVLTLVPMFVLSGLGGAWVPLEFTSPTVQAVGHFSPVAWMMDGFKNILIRGQGVTEIALPVMVLLGFALGFLFLSALRFRRVSA
jgi:ABC-2 type transport system permease protein